MSYTLGVNHACNVKTRWLCRGERNALGVKLEKCLYKRFMSNRGMSSTVSLVCSPDRLLYQCYDLGLQYDFLPTLLGWHIVSWDTIVAMWKCPAPPYQQRKLQAVNLEHFCYHDKWWGTVVWMSLCAWARWIKNTVKTLEMVLAVVIDIPETNWSPPQCRSGQSYNFEELASCSWQD